jgi:PPOX class probable FMN-dependent enzyme
VSNAHFTNVITSEEELRGIIGQVSDLARRKQLPALDEHARAFIALSPFVLVGTASANGSLDVSPRGDRPGFVFPLDDHTLVIPERPGNRRIDTLGNIIANPQIGLIFLIPGVEETLRVNGRACVVRDEALLERTVVQGKRSSVVIGVEVQECFFHCAKAFRRSNLWSPERWPERSALPTLGTILKDQLNIIQASATEIDCDLEEGYAKTLY